VALGLLRALGPGANWAGGGKRCCCWPLVWGGEWVEGQDEGEKVLFFFYFPFFYSKAIFQFILKSL